MKIKLDPAYFCLSCLHSTCPKDKPTYCTLHHQVCKARCKKFEAARGRVK